LQLNIGDRGAYAFTLGRPDEAREIAADLNRAADECAKIRKRN
jgi:hypothetical protein